MASRIDTDIDADKQAEAGPAAAPERPGRAKFMAFLPLAVTVVVMPVLAWAMTSFVLVPKLQKSLGLGSAVVADSSTPAGKGAAAAAPEEKVAGKQTFIMTKLLVNVAGTMGSRYLLTSLTIAGGASDFKARIEKHEAQLRDSACTILATKTITDLERPGARNLIRTELFTAFNNILGGSTVEEMYITELAIQ